MKARHPRPPTCIGRQAALALFWIGLLASFARQVQGQSAEEQPLLPWSAFDDDPIGLDPDQPVPARLRPEPATTKRPAPATTTLPVDMGFGPPPRHGRARTGAVLTAMPSVRETLHGLRATLVAGLAVVEIHQRFENSVPQPAEALYRLPLPPSAQLATLRVCISSRCRDGLLNADPGPLTAYDAALLARGPPVEPDAALPIADARPARDPRGLHLRVRAAPIRKGAPVDVYVSYVVETPARGGLVRLFLPPRGMDPRVAPASAQVRTPDLVDPRIDGLSVDHGRTVEVSPWAPTTIQASMPRPVSQSSNAPPSCFSLRYRCGTRSCTRTLLRLDRRPPLVRPLVIAIDVSPSMEGPARNRLNRALQGVLSAAPANTPVNILHFASRAHVVVKAPVQAHHLRIGALPSLREPPDLGSATRLHSAIELAANLTSSSRQAGVRPQLVVLTDGALTTGDGDPVRASSRLGLSLSLVNLSDDPTPAALTARIHKRAGRVLDVGLTARQANTYRADELWQEHMAALFQPATTAHQQGQRGPGPPVLPGQSITIDRQGRSAARRGCQRWSAATAWAAQDGQDGQDGQDRQVPPAEHFRSAQKLAAQGRALSAVDPRDLRVSHGDFPDAPQYLPKKKRAGRRCDRRGPAARHGGINRDDAPIIEAHARTCISPTQITDDPSGPAAGKAMPASSLRDMLRMRIVPAARDCFRRDRAGRLDYAVRAVFRFELARQEVVHSSIDGSLPDALRACLKTAVDRLHVPRFTGRVRVTYPLRTQREALPMQIELTSEAAHQVDAVLSQ